MSEEVSECDFLKGDQGVMSFSSGSIVKNSKEYNARDVGDPGSIPESGRSPWRRKWQLTPEFLPGESHGQRSLASYSPKGCKDSDKTKQLSINKELYDK